MLPTNQKGFTLVELIVVIALFAVVGGLAIGFFLSSITSRAKAEHRQEVQENSRLTLARIVYEIRRAKGAEVTTDYGVNLATTGGATLDLDMSTAGNDPTTFDIVGGVLRIKQGAGAATALTTDDVTVSNFTLEDETTTNGRSKNIKVTLQVDHVAGTTGEFGATQTVTTTVELRGK